MNIELHHPDSAGVDAVETTPPHEDARRTFTSTPIPATAIGQLFWAAQGITGTSGEPAAPRLAPNIRSNSSSRSQT